MPNDDVGASPPERRRLSRSMIEPATLDAVAEAVAAASEGHTQPVYPERHGDRWRWRWSLAHRGGPYPLLQVTARFLQISHSALLMSSTSIDGLCVVSSPRLPPPDAYAFIEVEAGTSTIEIASALEEKTQ